MLPPVAGPAAPISARQARAGLAAATPPAAPPNAASWWSLPAADALLTALLPQHQPFRDEARQRIDLCLRPSDDDPDRIELTEVVDAGGRGQRYVSAHNRLLRLTLDDKPGGNGICAWAEPSYEQALTELAEAMELPLQRCAERFGTMRLPQSTQGWAWHPALGFWARK